VDSSQIEPNVFEPEVDSTKFREATFWTSESYAMVPEKIHTPAFDRLLSTFIFNVTTVIRLHELLTRVTYTTSIFSRAAGLTPYRSGLIFRDLEDAKDPKNFEYFERFISEQAARLNSLPPIEAEREIINVGSQIVIETCTALIGNDESSNIKEGITRMYFSMVMTAYAAFETLAGDLWEEIVNLSPRNYRGDPQISFEQIREVKYNLSGKVGSFLRSASKVDFQSLPKIREAYGLIGTGKPSNYGTAISDPRLSVTAAVRNLIAHKSGVVDSKFIALLAEIKDRNREDTAISALIDDLVIPVGETLHLNGRQVSDLVNPCIDVASRLLTEADQWAERVVKADVEEDL